MAKICLSICVELICLVSLAAIGIATDCNSLETCEACSGQEGCEWCYVSLVYPTWREVTPRCQNSTSQTRPACVRQYNKTASDCPHCERQSIANCLDDERCGILNVVMDGNGPLNMFQSGFFGYTAQNPSCFLGDASGPWPSWHEWPILADITSQYRNLFWIFGADGRSRMNKECPTYAYTLANQFPPQTYDRQCVGSYGVCSYGTCQCTKNPMPANGLWQYSGQACEVGVMLLDAKFARYNATVCGNYTARMQTDGIPGTGYKAETHCYQTPLHPDTINVGLRGSVCCDKEHVLSISGDGPVCEKGYSLAFSEDTEGVPLACHAVCDETSACNGRGTGCSFFGMNASLATCNQCNDPWASPDCARSFLVDNDQCQTQSEKNGPCQWNETAHFCGCTPYVEQSGGFTSDSCSLHKTKSQCTCECSWCNNHCIRGNQEAGSKACQDFANAIGEGDDVHWDNTCISGGVHGLWFFVLLLVVAAAVGAFWWFCVRRPGRTWVEAIFYVRDRARGGINQQIGQGNGLPSLSTSLAAPVEAQQSTTA